MNAQRLIPALCCCLPCPAGGAPAATMEGQQGEYEVRAAYVFNFAKFVTWPERAFPGPEAPLVIGVWGQDSFRDDLQQVIGQRAVQKRRVILKRVRTGEDLAGCQILYLGAEASTAGPLLRLAARWPILTLGEGRAFCLAGGMIGFVRDKDRIRFEMNPEALERAGLIASSQLLMVARALVKTAPP